MESGLAVRELRAHLGTQATGRIKAAGQLDRLLAACWDDFEGAGEGGMQGYKLLHRMERAEWAPPLISFSIERHGRTVLGSTRADVQRWVVDVERMVAKVKATKSRQVAPTSQAHRTVDMRLEALELAEIIEAGREDDRIRWKADGRVHIVVSTMIEPSFQRTEAGRRLRFRGVLVPAMQAKGWAHEGKNVYRRTSPERVPA